MTGETFTDLLAPNLQSVRRLVEARLRASDHADDVLQDTLLHAFAHRDQLRAPDKFKSWLSTIAVNQVRTFLRQSRPIVSLDDVQTYELADGNPSPLARYEERERAVRLQTAINSLPERHRVAIRLVDFKGMSIREAASALTVSRSAAKSTHFRARRRLGHAIRNVTDDQSYEAYKPLC